MNRRLRGKRPLRSWLLWACIVLLLICPFVLLFVITNKQEPKSNQRPIHFIYTVGCGGNSDTDWQLLQSTALDSSFRRVKQRGRITRLVSGCTQEDKDDAANRKVMSQSILDEINIVFLPGSDRPDGKKVYVQANRPTALQMFFTQLMLEPTEELTNTVFIVLDPDFVFRKPVDEYTFDLVRDKHFVTQAYGLSSPNDYAYQACLEAVELSPSVLHAEQCNVLIGFRSYRDFYGGVPYMLQINDWLAVLQWWIPLIGPVLQRYPGIESDMISWALAAKLAGMQGHRQLGFMATCMSSEREPVTVLDEQVWLHLCQSYYVPETRESDAYLVNPTSELGFILSSGFPTEKDGYIYVFNKHWLKRSHLLEDCSVPLLVRPPPPLQQASAKHLWFQHVAQEAVDAYNLAVIEFRAKFHPQCKPPHSNKGLILHESRRSRYGGGWNHEIEM